MKSTPGANSTSFGTWPDGASRAISSAEITVTDAGASVTRSSRRDTEVTVIVSAKLTSQSTVLSTVRVSPAATWTPDSVVSFSTREKTRVYVPGATLSNA